jgi:RNA polymerase sigma-70 factor, ECF subfamily
MESNAQGRAEVTELLQRSRRGDAAAQERLLEVVYREVHELARRMMRGERREHTLQPTALVNEAWLRLLGHDQPSFVDRGHFLGVAARTMRRVLVDHARSRGARRREAPRTTASSGPDGPAVAPQDPLELLALEEVLARLEQRDPDAARVVELRYFAGLSTEESALALGWSVREVEGSWVFARGWLRRELERGLSHG